MNNVDIDKIKKLRDTIDFALFITQSDFDADPYDWGLSRALDGIKDIKRDFDDLFGK